MESAVEVEVRSLSRLRSTSSMKREASRRRSSPSDAQRSAAAAQERPSLSPRAAALAEAAGAGTPPPWEKADSNREKKEKKVGPSALINHNFYFSPSFCLHRLSRRSQEKKNPKNKPTKPKPCRPPLRRSPASSRRKIMSTSTTTMPPLTTRSTRRTPRERRRRPPPWRGKFFVFVLSFFRNPRIAAVTLFCFAALRPIGPADLLFSHLDAIFLTRCMSCAGGELGGAQLKRRAARVGSRMSLDGDRHAVLGTQNFFLSFLNPAPPQRRTRAPLSLSRRN